MFFIRRFSIDRFFYIHKDDHHFGLNKKNSLKKKKTLGWRRCSLTSGSLSSSTIKLRTACKAWALRSSQATRA